MPFLYFLAFLVPRYSEKGLIQINLSLSQLNKFFPTYPIYATEKTARVTLVPRYRGTLVPRYHGT